MFIDFFYEVNYCIFIFYNIDLSMKKEQSIIV